jgi:hypothetical protein
VFQLEQVQNEEDTRSYSCTISVEGFMGHEVDCDCLKCTLVRQ